MHGTMNIKIGLFCSFDKLRIWNYKDFYCEWCVPLNAVKVLRSGGSAPVVFKPDSVQSCVASFIVQERLSEFSLKFSWDSFPAHMSHTSIEFRWYQVRSREVLQNRIGLWRNVLHDAVQSPQRDSELQEKWVDSLHIYEEIQGKSFPPLHCTVLVGLPLCHHRFLSLINEHDDHSGSINWPYDPCRTLASFRINFQASVSLPIFLQPLTPIFFGSLSTSSKQLYIGFSGRFFLLWYF